MCVVRGELNAQTFTQILNCPHAKTYTQLKDGPHKFTQKHSETHIFAHTLTGLSNRQKSELWSRWMCLNTERKIPLLYGLINEEEVRSRSTSLRQRCHSCSLERPERQMCAVISVLAHTYIVTETHYII